MDYLASRACARNRGRPCRGCSDQGPSLNRAILPRAMTLGAVGQMMRNDALGNSPTKSAYPTSFASDAPSGPGASLANAPIPAD